MRKTITFLLLTAAMTSPLMAQDSGQRPDDSQQQDRRGDDRSERHQRAPDQRGQQQPAQQQQAQQQQAVQIQQQQRVQAEGQRGQAGQQRGQFGQQRGQQFGQRQQFQDRQAGGDPRVVAEGERRGPDGRGGYEQQRDYRQDGRQDGRRDGRDYRQDGRNDGRDWRGDDRGNGQYGQNWQRGNDGRWNNSWRNDRRYDWQGYRNQNRSAYRMPRYYAPRGYGYEYRRWSPGIRIQPYFYGSGYWISDPWQYRLPPAYGSYRWVRYYNDVALVDIRTGLIADVIYSFFW